MIATTRSLFATFLGEPIALVRAQPHQLFISTASVALMGSFASSSGILDPSVGYLLAVGIEWAYFRGLASDSKCPTAWGVILNWSACLVVILWGMLWVAETTHTIEAASAGWWLAAAHVVPIAWLSLCSAQTHRAAMVAEVGAQRAEADRVRREEQEERAYQRSLREQRDLAALELERKYKEMKIQEEARTLRANSRRQIAEGPPNASGTGTNSGREQLREQIRRTLAEQPDIAKAELARRVGIGRTLLYELLKEL